MTEHTPERQRCTCCERPLHPDRIVSLELDQRVNRYHDFEGVPESHSQGWFPFGPGCAKRAREEARAALAQL